jgi:hypothetical protein
MDAGPVSLKAPVAATETGGPNRSLREEEIIVPEHFRGPKAT